MAANHQTSPQSHNSGRSNFQLDSLRVLKPKSQILPDGGIELRFSVDDIIDAVLAVPGLRTRLEKRIEESAARFGEPDLDDARQAVLGTFVQSPDISQQRLYDVDLIAFSVRLDLLRSESMVLFLQPVGMSLRVIGYCHIPDRIFEVLSDRNRFPTGRHA